MRVLIVYRDFLLNGGLPVDARKFVSNFPKDVCVTVACKENVKLRKELSFNFIILDSAIDILTETIDSSFDYGVFIGFSSLYNVLLAIKIKTAYVVLPFSQINHFLDYDNPFFEKILPDVRSLEKNKIKYPKLSRVKNGKRDIFSVFRRIKRGLFRQTLGAFYLKKADAIGVFSKYEKEEINRFYKNNSFKYFFYRFGVDCKNLNIGSDKYEEGFFKLKLVIWSRTDFYYKGIDRILKAVKDLSKENFDINFKLYIVGPDYNDGYKRIEDFVEQNKINEHVQLLKTGSYTSGTLGLLAESDLSICLSRWDGPPRVFRESIELGVPVLGSKESNFDVFVDNFDCGYIVNNQIELFNMLKNIDKYDILTKRENAKKYKNYFSWKESSSDFISELKKI